MKSSILCITLLICFWLQAKADDESAYTFQDGSKLAYSYKSDASGSLSKLEFVASESSIVMQVSKLPGRVLINGNYADKFYAQSEIVTAAKNDSVIVVVFKNAPGHQSLIPVHAMNFGVAPVCTSNNDYLVKSFVERNGKWESYLSFYPQTLYGDTVDQVISGITIISKDHYRIHYNGTWQIVGTVFREIDKRKKSFKEGGETLKEVKYDPEHKLLLGLSGDQKSYSKTFIWWSTHHQIASGKDLQTHLNEYAGKAAELGIPQSNFEYFSRLGPEDQIDPYEKFLNKQLEE